MRAEIITIGEELLSGDSDIIDTNSIFLTKMLRSTGIHVLYKTTVGDDEQRITDVVRLALDRVDVIITTGGLGPTVDDMTRQGVAAAVGRKLEFRQDLMDDIAAKFARFGTRMSDNNRIQAMLPEAATVIHNPVGTAPAFLVEHAGKLIISLPGVPREMKYLTENSVLPILRDKAGASGIIKNRVLRTAGLGESLIDEKIGDLEKLANPTVGLAAHAGQTDIRIAARAATEAEADALIADLEREIRKRLGSFIYGVDKEPLEAVFLAALEKAGGRAAMLEVGTGGRLRQRIENQPGGAGRLLIVDAAPLQAEMERLHAAHGPDLATDYKKLVEGAVRRVWESARTTLAIVIVSENGGTAIAVTNGKDTHSRAYAYGGTDLAGAPEWASGWGMSMGWRLLTAGE